jgi:hypothetical protein
MRPDGLSDMFHSFWFEVSQVVDLSSMPLNFWKHFVFALALQVPLAIVAHVFAVETPRHRVDILVLASTMHKIGFPVTDFSTTGRSINRPINSNQ